MKLYRVTRPLSSGRKTGDLVTVADFGGSLSRGNVIVKKLTETGALSPVKMPPLAALPGCEKLAALLKRRKITTAEELLSVNADKLAKKLGCEPELIRGWQEAVKALMTPGGALSSASIDLGGLEKPKPKPMPEPEPEPTPEPEPEPTEEVPVPMYHRYQEQLAPVDTAIVETPEHSDT